MEGWREKRGTVMAKMAKEDLGPDKNKPLM